MKAFGGRGYLLRNARLEVRLVYTAFLSVRLDRHGHHGGASSSATSGRRPSRVAAYYRGGERDGEMTFAKTSRELVETTHFHAFIMGIVYLVLAHLFIATRAAAAVKRLFIVLAFAGLAGDLVAPWLGATFRRLRLSAGRQLAGGVDRFRRLHRGAALARCGSRAMALTIDSEPAGRSRAPRRQSDRGRRRGALPLRQPDGAADRRPHRAQVPPLQTRRGGRRGARHAAAGSRSRRTERTDERLSAPTDHREARPPAPRRRAARDRMTSRARSRDSLAGLFLFETPAKRRKERAQ